MAQGGKMDLTDDRFSEFLDRLANDDEFRASLRADPAAALERIGVHVRPGDLPDEIELPPKEELQAEFEEYLEEARGRMLMPIIFKIFGTPCPPKPPFPGRPGS